MSELKCLDCQLPYSEFPVDVVLPHGQWCLINPGGEGVLCAGCIVKRAAKVPGVFVCHLIFEMSVSR
jgi:hypothetical protein